MSELYLTARAKRTILDIAASPDDTTVIVLTGTPCHVVGAYDDNGDGTDVLVRVFWAVVVLHYLENGEQHSSLSEAWEMTVPAGNLEFVNLKKSLDPSLQELSDAPN